MTYKQQPILVLGKEYFPNPAPLGGCGGCVGFDNSELCEALPYCHRTIFVERKLCVFPYLNGEVLPQPDDSDINQVHDGNAKPDTLLEVSRLCDQARADGYAKGMAAKQAEWDKWQASCSYSSRLKSEPLARSTDPTTSHKAARDVGRKAGRIADLILVELQGSNLTGSMLAERTGVALNSITPRFAQLFRKGLIHAVGGNGRETVWAIGNGVSST